MKKITFTTQINAPATKVWSALWDDANYREWTAVFSEGSYAVSDWKEGSRIEFLSADGGGMFSKIVKMTPNEYMSFEHLGEMKDFKEQPIDDKTRQWAGAKENYTLKEKNGGTELTMDMDITDDFAAYFEEKYPVALEKVKLIAERS